MLIAAAKHKNPFKATDFIIKRARPYFKMENKMIMPHFTGGKMCILINYAGKH